jgi:uncharacterized Zn finger protein
MAIPELSEATIRAHAAPESFQRGWSYYKNGAVRDLALRGNVLHASVEGSQHPSYRVNVTFDKGGVTAATCTCPYDWGGWCKHIVAALLRAIHHSGEVVARPPLDEQLKVLDRGQLQALILALAARSPDLSDSIERQLALLHIVSAPPTPQKAAARRSPIDTSAISKQVQYVLRNSPDSRYEYDYYDDEDPARDTVDALRPILDQARGFINGGDALSALAILEAFTTSYLAHGSTFFEEIEEMYGSFEGTPGDFFEELAEIWAEAILSADLNADERDEWGEKIAGWNDEIDDLGGESLFGVALAAAEQGWEYPPLQRVLAGEITPQGAWQGEPPEYADTLALLRLRALERQGRFQEYLYLAEAEGQLDRYVLMLAKMGQSDQALAEGTRYLANPDDILAVATVLRERGALEQALRLAEHGLALPVPHSNSPYAISAEVQRAPLAIWAAELATGMGERERALRAADTALRIAPSLAAYRMVQEQAGDEWEALRGAALARLRNSPAVAAKVDIFLHENMIDDAIAAVRDSSDYSVLERVMTAAVPQRPDWVIEAASRQAQRIMEAGKSDRYFYAITWLTLVRDAYKATGRADGWRAHVQSIRAQHGRKYKLMGMIDQLR